MNTLLDEIHYSQEYGIDNRLNPFGDYDQLRCECWRDARYPGSLSKVWRLVSSRRIKPELTLHGSDIIHALENQFFRNSKISVVQDSSISK